MKTISIRELHARTGHWVRHAAANGGVAVTANGSPVATLKSIEDFSPAKMTLHDRPMVSGYKAIMDKPVKGDSTESISEDRDRA